MARTFDASAIFDQERYSEIVVRFGARSRKCHKMILCSKSRYIDNLCGPDKKFAKSSNPEIELKDDDAEEVEATLRRLYTSDYEHHFQQRMIVEGNGETGNAHDEVVTRNTLDLHLSVCVVADKYELLDLHNEALTRFRKELENTNENEVSRVFEQVREEESTYAQAIIDVINVVRDIRLGPTSLTICSFDKTPLNTYPKAFGCFKTSSMYTETEQQSDVTDVAIWSKIQLTKYSS
ncbi:hypothetical protein LTR97_005319 [Elasticomyces elasticus]|uniref:BTB domain-containing protein n=1 Tax=Elasticomyces elasticus TaxID=574655 RepID=A0AAN8A368_9PEZI|nr:hypothetical protein LTR97_005319 [Elasticomyces elasticus]